MSFLFTIEISSDVLNLNLLDKNVQLFKLPKCCRSNYEQIQWDQIFDDSLSLHILDFQLNDTIGGLLCFATLMLAMYPEVQVRHSFNSLNRLIESLIIVFQEKARAEVREVVQEEELTMDAISHLDYIDMIVRETIRLFPVGPLLPRVTTEPIELSNYFNRST